MYKIPAFSYLSILLSATLLVGCMGGEQEISSQGDCIPRKNFGSGIVGGYNVGPGDRYSRNAVLLTYTDSQKKPLICSGVLVARNAVLTAAHCVRDAYDVRVNFHTDVTCESGYKQSTKSISAVVRNINPSHRPGIKGAYDLALIRLSSDAPAHYPVMPIYNGSSPLTSSQVTILGYGTTGPQNGDSMFLRSVSKSVKKVSRHGLNLWLDQSDKKGICLGDSGGPLFYEVDGRLTLAGINSAVSGESALKQCQGTSIIMYVPNHRSWIDRVLASWQ